jgi:VWFA-related protein
MNRFHTKILAGALVAVTAAALPVLAQRGNNRQFSEAVDVVTVEVPVEVVRDGEPLGDLTIDNFEIFEGRKRQTITGFEKVDLRGDGGTTLPISDIPIAARRHFLLLFDLGFSDPSVISRARQSALDLVEKEFHPADLVAVATYSPNVGPQLVLGFTPDREQVKVAVETLGLQELVERSSDPLSLVITDDTANFRQSIGTSGEDSGGGLAGAREDLFITAARDLSIGMDRQQRGEQQGRVLSLTKDLENLARALDDVQGRKHVVYLSEGFDASVILGTDDQESVEAMAAASSTGEFWRVDSEERYGSTGTLGALETMLEEFRRADCTIQAVDIGGLRAGNDARARAGGRDSLFMMANETGGELYQNFNDLGGAMNSMLERTSVTYVLAFQPEVELDGEYHKIRVELKGVDRGAKVVHRPGYYAPRPFNERSGLERTFDAANKILDSGDSGILSTSVVAAPFRADAGRAYVPILIEIDGPTLLSGLTGDTAGLEIYAYAIADDGSVGGYMTQTMGIDVTKVRPALEATGLKFFGDMELPPGDYILRVLVRDAQDGRSATRVVPLSVPEFGSGAPTLAMPLFPEPGGKWLMVQESSGSDARSARPYPFVLGESSYIPAAKPVVAQGGSAQFVVLGYNLGGDSVPLETRFESADGSVVEGPTVSFVSRGQGASPDSTQLVLQLDANGLAPGEYRLVAGLTGQERTTSIPFVVAGS